jgi:hypothetical protein
MYKNWAEICKLGRCSAEFMHFFVTTDPQSKLGQLLASRFPECYSEQAINGPKPLSMFYDPKKPRDDQRFHRPVAEGHGVPVFTFSKNGREMRDYWHKLIPPLPSTIDPNSKVGEIVDWNGEDFIVVQATGFGVDLWEFKIVPLASVDPEV